MSAQLFGNPRVLAMSGGFLLFLALLPGPARAAVRRARGAAARQAACGVRRALAAGAAQRPAFDGVAGAPPELAPLTLELDPTLHTALVRAPEAPLRAALDRAQARLALRLGMPWPALSITRAEELAGSRYRIALYATPHRRARPARRYPRCASRGARAGGRNDRRCPCEPNCSVCKTLKRC